MPTKKIRILYLIDALESDQAGTESQLIKLMCGLSKDRFECYCACFKPSKWLLTSEIDIPLFFIGSTTYKSYKFYLGLISFIKYLRQQQIDIVHAFFPTSITTGVVVARIARVKCIISSRRDMGFWYTPFLKLFLSLSNRFIKRFIANSFAIKNLIVEKEGIVPDKISVIYNCIEPPQVLTHNEINNFKVEMELPQNALIIGTVANMNRPVKRLDVFIHAAALVLNKIPNVYFLIIGSGHYLEELKTLASKLNLQDRVKFLGSQGNSMRIIQTFDVGVNSSDSEGFSNAVLEYMICGKPVVATNCGGNIEIITDGITGFLVPPGNPTDMSNSIIRCFQCDSKREQMGKNARELALQFSSEKMIKKHATLYNNLNNKILEDHEII